MNAVLRPARSTDAGATGAILMQFQTETDWMPTLITGAQAIGHCGDMIDEEWVVVAQVDGMIVGFIARDDQEICALYVARAARGQGVGAQLLSHAKDGMARLWLRVFEVNTGAQRFYARAGFRESARGDGSRNEENLPEITYVWQRDNII